MSLLLDALKKAEKEKQKVREAEAMAFNHADTAMDAEQETISETLQVQSPPVQSDEAMEELELVMDAEPALQEESEQESVAASKRKEKEPEAADPSLTLEKNAATTSTVSDSALQLLIYKTNKRHRQKQKLLWGSLLSVAFIILVVAGAYHYFGVLEEVEALERKHKLAMRVVQAEPVKRRQIPAPPAIPKKVEAVQASQSKTEQQAKAAVKPVAKPDAKPARPAVEVQAVENNYSVRQTRTQDPINTLLQQAWLAYNKADYSLAESAYEKVLQREPKNRDALLGMAAVAIKNNEIEKAKQSYRLLLRLDPRDQVANAAMANLDEAATGIQDESRLKLLLQQQPSAVHLNYALGNYYARQAKWPEAQAAYFKAWQGDAENADYAFNLAVSLDQLGKTKEALRFYQESLKLAGKQNIGFSKSDVEKRINSLSAK